MIHRALCCHVGLPHLPRPVRKPHGWAVVFATGLALVTVPQAAHAVESGVPEAPELRPGWESRLPPHPRLVLTPERLEKVRVALKDPLLRDWLEKLRQKAVADLDSPVPQRELRGRRMLDTSRKGMRRLLGWSLLYRLDGDKRFLDAACRELDALTEFTDWNPSHYLDTAEMAAGVALAYDWLHGELGRERESRIEFALRRLALATFQDAAPKLAGMSHNWNSVCHGGLVLAALAIAEKVPDEATATLRAAIPAVGNVRPTYAPDGVFTEGPMYWDYGTAYLCLLADALQTCFGDTHGVERVEGVLSSAGAMEHLTSPAGRPFNFADGRDSLRTINFATAWIADRSDDPFLLRRYADRVQAYVAGDAADRLGEMERLETLAFVFAALHPPPEGGGEEAPLAWAGQGPVPVAAMRTSWTDPSAAYIAIKGGSASFSHAHMDVGSFVYDWGRVRWFGDPDRQDYDSLESAGFTDLFDTKQTSRRWEVFRNGAESHNILRFAGGAQDVRGVARRMSFDSDPLPRAEIDLTPVYAEWVSDLRRSVSLFPDGRAVVEDRWTLLPAHAGVEVAWQFGTSAAVEVIKGGVRLRQDGRFVSVLAIEPAEVRVSVVPADSLTKPHDADNPGLMRVQFLARGSGGFRVLIAPEGTEEEALPPRHEAN